MPLESNETLDREDAPFLASGQRPSSPVEEESGPSDAEKEHLRKTRLRLMLTLFAMILAVEVGICMSNGPVTRIYESIACREYYTQYDPTQIGADGEVQEELCKVKAVQQDLAAVKGYMEFFDGILSAVLAIPYGLLADRRGRKSTICLSIPGFALNCIIQLVVMWRPDVFPLRTVWASSLAWLFGGGPVVAFAIIWTMMSDVSTEEERFGVASMGADFASSAASSWLMALDPWLPLLLGWGLAVVGMFFALSLPETMRVGSSQPSWKQPSMEMSQVSPGNAEYKEVPSKEQEHEVLSDEETLQGEEASFTTKAARPTFFASAKQRSRAYFAPYSFIFRNKQIMLLLTAFLVYRLSRGSSWFLVQYISTRYKWTLAEANFLMSFKPALTIPLFLFILPAISRQLLKTMKPTQKDLQLMRISIGLLAVGTLGIGLSPSVAMLIPSLLVQTSGSGFVFLTRALITTLVNREETARLFTIIEVLQSVGNVIASLSITTVFQIGLELGGAWIGLAWMMTATAFTLVGVAIWMFRIPSRQSDDKTWASAVKVWSCPVCNSTNPSYLVVTKDSLVMERFTQFRDRGTGVSPFFPTPRPSLSYPQWILRIFLFCVRLPFFIPVCIGYFLLFQWLPITSLGRKAALWCILGVPSIWWVDLQVDGVRKGTLNNDRHQNRLPGPGSIIASSFTSPIDALYLAAVFDPIFVSCYPSTREVEQLSVWQAILRAFALPQAKPQPKARTVDLKTIMRKYPGRPIALFPECTTTNGQGVLPLSPVLASAPHKTKIFPVALRYEPKDVVTPVPGSYITFLWSLLGRPTHYIKVRIGQAVVGVAADELPTHDATMFDPSASENGYPHDRDDERPFSETSVMVLEEQVPNYVGDSLARLGRARRVAVTAPQKLEFVKLWKKSYWTW
ncbi:hypothetical protein ASPFODRAFT_27487 [Aspergillus luchuensis CBS 106.47]|uniref:MFS general substrate transporter n=2 Tax=Aspergillus kawachii TaxID=1069201 RepID=A0A1M3TXY9_ASPLC|nr:hypothetical protein ASPFODRAFT_27487 [Aspergillus luchuensis CBS 106.47]